MSSTSDAALDVQHKVGASGVLGVRLFWKLSSLSRRQRRLRQKEYLKDVLSPESQISVSERSEFRSLTSIREESTAVRRCSFALVALSHSSSFYPSQLFSAAFVKQLDRETLKVLIEQGELHLDSWFEVEDTWKEEIGGGMGEHWNDWEDGSEEDDTAESFPRLKYWKPLLILLIEAHNFECAEFLLEAGARTDVCEWLAVAERDDSPLQVSHRRHWETNFFCPGKTPLHSLLLSIWRKPTAVSLTEDEGHAQKLRLLQRIAAVASKSNTQCLEWKSFIPLSKTEMCSLFLACFSSSKSRQWSSCSQLVRLCSVGRRGGD
uniref:Uncharacterized protein n=1 Tax=Chromera velia CCMP2878 TaxID=1169474 RepID=A0A0G4GQ89_9ALVE|eukprot:Cvel_725.t1-p1 / transcript=Cvel_725.t1 / gene=Cvel_725 / organism=Chromera_velia_CCMP2878 / gene_product=hypothetical protein / transcript_product=hypothetical protein / location=Cvel_scaffold22:145707-146761(+) / protein_length=319 / sequence_SO=supercontig / SO=protein_coding / is_pseudo=false